MLFWHEFDFKVFPYLLSKEEIPPITQNLQEIVSCYRTRHLGTANNSLPQDEISCHKKESSCSYIKGRNFLSKEIISCCRQKFLYTERNFLSEAEMSCHRRKFPVTRKNFITRRNTQITAISDSRCFGRNFWLKVLAPAK